MSHYVQSGTKWVSQEVRSDVFQNFEDVTICRPKMIYFKATGLWPNTVHRAFFDGTDVTAYVNTNSVTISDYMALTRNSPLRNPGEKYIAETGFPIELGGGSEIKTDLSGTVEGVFYLQSNATLNFPTGTRKLELTSDTSEISKATGTYVADGGLENYEAEYHYTQVEVPNMVKGTHSSSSNDNDGGIKVSYETLPTGGKITVVDFGNGVVHKHTAVTYY